MQCRGTWAPAALSRKWKPEARAGKCAAGELMCPTLLTLPAYAPDLNRAEQCNAVLKKAMLDALPASIEEMRGTLRREFRRLQHRPRPLRALVRHAGLLLQRPT